MALFVDLVALSNGLHGSVQMDSVALFSWIGWLRHRGILILIKKVDFPFLKHDSLVKTSELRVVSEARLGNVLGHKELEDPKIIDIWRIAHSFYFPSYDYKMNNLIKENSFLKMMIVASKINKTYTINEFTDLNDLIDIDTTKYTLEIGIPKLMSSTQYMVEIKMRDIFNQEITKSVECRLKTD